MENTSLGSMALPTALVVEDHDMVRAVLAQMLERLGFRVIEAANGSAALEILKKHRHPIDLVLSDLVMPGAICGNKLAMMARQLRPTVHVLLITGYAEGSLYVEAALKGNEVLLSKPISSAQLGDAIADAFDLPLSTSDGMARYGHPLRQRSPISPS